MVSEASTDQCHLRFKIKKKTKNTTIYRALVSPTIKNGKTQRAWVHAEDIMKTSNEIKHFQKIYDVLQTNYYL